MDSKLELRLEAVRIAAQLGHMSVAEVVKDARKIEKYILGKAVLPEHISVEEVVKQTVHESILEATGASDVIHKLEKMDKDFKQKHPELELNAWTCASDEATYLSPGGMPSSEAESIFLQVNGDKVE